MRNRRNTPTKVDTMDITSLFLSNKHAREDFRANNKQERGERITLPQPARRFEKPRRRPVQENGIRHYRNTLRNPIAENVVKLKAFKSLQNKLPFNLIVGFFNISPDSHKLTTFAFTPKQMKYFMDQDRIILN